MEARKSEIFTINGKTLELNFHEGQWEAWDSTARIVVILAGVQSGKTSFGPFWAHREIQRTGAGDGMVVTPTYKLLNLKALPEFLNLFKKTLSLGENKKIDKVFEFDRAGEVRTFGQEQDVPTRILFGYATDPDTLASATLKWAWLDEAGQSKFKLSSFDAILMRLSISQGRILITTTPYNLGWIKQKLWDNRITDDDIHVVRFDSTMNPVFPQEEMDRARRDLPRWKFDMFYRAIFTRPAGMIYDCFRDGVHKIKQFPIPFTWKKYAGVDFGGVNTAAVKIAVNPANDNWYVFSEYHEGNKTAAGHATKIQSTYPVSQAYGGAPSEDQWRLEFSTGGLPVHQPPISDVEVGIDRIYGAFKNGRLFIMDNCVNLLDEIGSYSRETDDTGEPTEKIADKSTYHLLDALRYIMSHLNNSGNYITVRNYR